MPTSASHENRPARSVHVVDDDAMLREMIAAALVQDGWKVSAFADGTDVVLAATTDPPDIVVTDLVMPGLPGDELVAWMRRRPATVMVPVLVVTAVHGDDPRLLALQTDPVVSVLRKPFRVRELLRRVRDAAER